MTRRTRYSPEVRTRAVRMVIEHRGEHAAACHCAVVARYPRPPLRVAALRRNAREIVDAARPSRRATSCIGWPCARSRAISSRSANDRCRPDGGLADGMNIARRQATCLPEASHAHRLGHTGRCRGSLARRPCRYRRPEQRSFLSPRNRWPTRRRHRLASRSIRSPLPPAHRNLRLQPSRPPLESAR